MRRRTAAAADRRRPVPAPAESSGCSASWPQPPTVDAARWLAKQLTVVASNAFTHDDFRRSMALLADGRVRRCPCTPAPCGSIELETTLRELAAGPTPDIKVLVDPRRSYAKESA